jgi:hypothetical protein
VTFRREANHAATWAKYHQGRIAGLQELLREFPDHDDLVAEIARERLKLERLTGLRVKYRRAVRYPWLPVDPDPPETPEPKSARPEPDEHGVIPPRF